MFGSTKVPEGSQDEATKEDDLFMGKKAVAIATMLLLTGTMLWAGTAGNIALEGSDATTFHQEGTYTQQLFTYLQNGSTLPVLIMGGIGLSGLNPGQSVLDPGYSLSGYNLANFSAVYIESLGGCCTQADTQISAADEAAIGAARLTGLSVAIENYGGGPAWGQILPAAIDALPASDFAGITDYGTGGPPFCTDNEKFTPFAIAHGFSQPPVLGCWEHQGILFAPFQALGFNSLVTADPAYFGGAPASAFLALGGTLGTVPEPASLMLLGTALLGSVGVIRRKLGK